MAFLRMLLVGLALSLIVIPTLASARYDRGGPYARGWSPKKSLGAPAPVAGIGLPVLIAAGGYVWLRRRQSAKRQQRTDDAS